MRRRTLLAGLTGALLLAGCAGPGAGDPDDPRLAQAWSARDDAARVEELCADLLGSSSAERAGERFWAAWTLTQAQALAALREATSPDAALGHARAAHEVAALYHARQVRSELDAALRAPRPALHADLSGCDPVDAAAGLELVRLGLLGRLGFEGRVRRLAQERPALLDPRASEGILAAARVDARLHAGVWWALFDELEHTDELAAFACAARALGASDRTPGALEAEQVGHLEDWIRTGASYAFRCPTCRQDAVPELRACPNDHTPLERFFGEARP